MKRFLLILAHVSKSWVRTPRPMWLLFIAILVSGASCAFEPSPTRAHSAILEATPLSFVSRSTPWEQDPSPILETPLPTVVVPERKEAAAIFLDPDESLVPATKVPQPSGSGIRPDQAVMLRSPEMGPQSPADWRPPPVAVPHALNPDDHYWLMRPLPSTSRNYELEWYPYGNRPTRPEALPYRVHHGMDFPNEPGTAVFAVSSGTVIWAGPLVSNRDGINYYGNTIVIHHDWQWLGQDVYTLYAHTLELFVEVGDYVDQGQLLAGVGATGHVSGPHLHLEVRVGENNYSNTRNPALWLAPYEGWGTLAGRFIDSRGREIHGAMITVYPLHLDSYVDAPVRRQRTYAPDGPNGDEIWQENFVFGDLPAGDYRVVLTTAGATFRRDIRVKAGQTNFMIVQADFRWAPTATPSPTNTPLPTSAATAMPLASP